MNCPKCGAENAADASFCLKCGEKLERACGQCGRPLPPGAVFCDSCGAPVAGGKAAGDQAAGPAPSAIQGERRQATVLFSDLSGFTAMSEKLDPEEVQGLMRRLKDRAVEIVEAHGGIVSQFVGDEVLALFGIPTAHEDDPVRAVRAAQGLHDLARELSPEVEGKIGRPLTMHTGIDSGLVVTSTADVRDGTIGVTGDTVNTGARLKAMAAEDRILLSPETARLVGDFFETEALEPAELKGKAAPVTPRRVVGKTPARTRFEAAQQRGFTPYIGRERELSQLRRCLENAINGEGQYVTVVGEPGIGKSRLIYELRHEIDPDRVAVLEGRCQSYGAETPYLPFLDALRRALQLKEDDPPDQLLDKAIANIAAIDPELERYLPHILQLLSISSEEHRLPETLQGEALRHEFEEALAAIITLSARQKPLALIFEDWHWADEASDSALKNLVGLVGHYSLLLVVLFRPDYTRGSVDLEHYTPVLLKSLDVAHTDAMLCAVLGVNSLPVGLGELIHVRTGGNPFFNEEIGHALEEEGIVRVEGGEATLTQGLDALRLPDTVHAVIRARVDRLEPETREVLRLAAVIGRDFDRAILERLYVHQISLNRALDELIRQDLVQPLRLLPRQEFIFKNALTQVVVYETLLRQQRREIHKQVAASMEILFANRIEEHVEALAFHYGKSNDAEKAVDFAERAAAKAEQVFSLDHARRWYRDALKFIGLLLPSDEVRSRRISLTHRWAGVSHFAPVAEHVSALETALADAEALGEDSSIAHTVYWLGRMHYNLGHMEESLAFFDQCSAMAASLDDEELSAQIHNTGGRICWTTGQFEKGIQHFEAGIGLLEKLGEEQALGAPLGMLGQLHGVLGNFSTGQALIQRALNISRRDRDLPTEGVCLLRLALLHFYKGNWAEVISSGNRSVEIAETTGNRHMSGASSALAAYAAYMSGQRSKGFARIRDAIEIIERHGSNITPYWYGMAATISLSEGDLGLAQDYAEKGMTQVRDGIPVGESIVMCALAEFSARASSPNWTEAKNRFEKGLQICRESGTRPDLAFIHFRYAECLHKKGDGDAAREQLDQAEALFRDMGMDWWTERAEGLRGRIDGGKEFVWFAPYEDGAPG